MWWWRGFGGGDVDGGSRGVEMCGGGGVTSDGSWPEAASDIREKREVWLGANSLTGATHQLSSGNHFAITVAKYSSSGIFITSSGNALEHFIPNNPPLNLMLHLQSSFQNQMLIWRGCFNRFFI
nr:hypothetical protein [Tanacetum cinerariifolium]